MTTQTSRLVIEIDSRNAERNARAIANELQNIQRNGDSATRSMNSTSAATRSLAGYMAGLVTVGAAIAKMDTYTGLQNRLKLVTDSQKELNQAMDDTFKIAQNTGSAWDSVAMVYQRFADNADRLGISMSKTAELTETVSKAIAISGGNAASAEAALTQFGQALASGVLRGEEFNSIAEQAPGLLKAIAFGMDVNIGKLRAMAADGKITGDALVEALTKAQPHVDDLFGKTDFTIANSLTQLSNAVTQFVGEAGKGSGAASLLSDSISALANNLEMVSNVAVVGGVALLTKAILTQTVAIHGSVAASIQRRTSLLAELQAQVTLSAAEVSRISAIAQLTAMQLADAKATALRMSGIQRLAYVQNVVIPLETRAAQATAAHTSAVAANTATQNINNAARARSTMLLGAVGGPIGALTIGVAALAAGYMYMQHRTQQANEKLAEQMQWAEKTKQELLALEGVQREVATNELSDAFDKQNTKLRQLNNEFLGFIDNIARSNRENTAAADIFEKARKGTLSQADALEQLNKLDVMTAAQKKQGFDMVNNTILQTEETLKAKKALSVFGIEAKLGGNAASNMAAEQNALAGASDNAARGIRNAADAVADYNQKLKNQKWDLEFTNNLIQQHGFSAQEADLRLQAYRENEKKGIKGTTAEQRELIKGIVKQQESADAYNKSQRDAESARSRASKKAASDAAREAKQQEKEAEQQKEEILQSQYDISYRYADRTAKMESDLLKEQAEIRKAYASDPNSMKLYLDSAKKRHDDALKLYDMELGLELHSFKANEVEKLNIQKGINLKRIQSSNEYSEEEKKSRINSENQKYQHELGLIMLAKEQRIFQAEQAMMTEIQVMQKRYALEREEIIRTTNDLEERKRKLVAFDANFIRGGVGRDREQSNGSFLNSVDFTPKNDLKIDALDSEYVKELDKMKARFEQAKLLNAENNEALLEAERQFQEAKEQLQEEYGAKIRVAQQEDYMYQMSIYGQMISAVSSTFGQMMSIVEQVKDENTKTYKTMFALNKAAAFAQAIVNTEEGATKALAQGGIYGAALAMVVRASGYASAGIIAGQALAGPGGNGYADGGFTGAGGKFDPAGIVHKGEVVWSQEDIKRWGGVSVVEAMRTSQPPKGYSDGGIVSTPKDTYRVGMGTVDAINRGADIQAERQAQAAIKAQSANPQKIMNNLRVIMVKDEDEAKDMLYGPDGEKAFLYHQRRNRRKA